MTMVSRLADLGMAPEAVAAREALLDRVLGALAGVGASGEKVVCFVPGRIEVLGKHTDYAGGRSLVCAVDRGFVVAAAPRADRTVRVLDVAGHRDVRLTMAEDLPDPGEAWARYPATVLRRVARNFPDARTGADLAFVSDLPLASGMSSSSAFMVAVFLAVAGINRLRQTAAYRREIHSAEELAGYLATVENGQSFGSLTGDSGVGTFGGSEDHTAMLCGRAGELSQYSFCPVRHERQLPFPRRHVFIVGVSGVVAEKTGAAKAAYNRASLAVRAILEAWRTTSGTADASLAAAVDRGSAGALRESLARATVGGFSVASLRDRLDQFIEESVTIIPAAGDALLQGDLGTFATLVDRSQHLAETLLRNQVPETVALASSARRLGAVAASAFGAGFGGSVWALAPTEGADDLTARWREEYAARFPTAARGAAFLVTRPGPAAVELSE